MRQDLFIVANELHSLFDAAFDGRAQGPAAMQTDAAYCPLIPAIDEKEQRIAVIPEPGKPGGIPHRHIELIPMDHP